jgi:hypothetical protein
LKKGSQNVTNKWIYFYFSNTANEKTAFSTDEIDHHQQVNVFG